MLSIVPTQSRLAASYRECLDTVAREKRYLAQISAEDCRQLLQTPTPSPEHGTPTR